MKVAIIVPARVNQGPVTVARDIISGILLKYPGKVDFSVFYFDKSNEIDFPCESIHIKLSDNIDFSQFDVIHSHMLRSDFFVWKNRKKLKNTLKISTLHQNIVANLTASYNILIAYICYIVWIRFLNCFDNIVSLSNVMKDLYKNKFSNEKLITIYNGRELVNSNNEIDADDVLTINNLKKNYTLIGVVALLTKRKGVHQLIQSLAKLPNHALIIVGNGQEMENLVTLSNELGVNNRCFFTGYKKNGKDYMKYFDLFAMTSYSEGFPLSILEVSQFYKPVVCSNIPLFKELFGEDEVSFFTLDDDLSLQKAIEKATEKQEFFGKNLNLKVNKSYSYDIMIDSYMKLYSQNNRI